MTKPKTTTALHSRERSKRLRSSPLISTPVLVLLGTTCLTSPQHHNLVAAQDACNPCEGISAGFVQIPDTACAEFAQCSGGAVSKNFACQGGLIFDKNLGQCNWSTTATCGPDPPCPTASPTVAATASPTPSPVRELQLIDFRSPTANPETLAPTARNAWSVPSGQQPPPAPPSDSTPAVAAPAPPAPDRGLEPIRREHHAAVWAHLNANKIGISNRLLRSARRTLRSMHGNNLDAKELRNYAYYNFYGALRSMAEEGYVVPGPEDAAGNRPPSARNVFYLGDPRLEDAAAAVGLVNVAAFLSQALADSVSNGSCDEMNEELVGGSLPVSNSCGQYGLSYQDMHCSDEESFMECFPYPAMEMGANPNGRPVSPFYCGPQDKYPFTGTANFIAGRTPVDSPVPNQNGRTEVEGCCWWGRGTINTRGVCQYGKLNYYLGARAAQEGRPARYPHLDFCASPQSVCSSHAQDASVEWTSGLFRWIEDVQSYASYNSDGTVEWSYIQKLHEFVAGGMTDGLFIRSVSSIVTQGCHQAPCPDVAGTNVEMSDAAERWSYFLQALEALGLPVMALRQE